MNNPPDISTISS